MTARERIEEEKRLLYELRKEARPASDNARLRYDHLYGRISGLNFALDVLAEDEARTCGECDHFTPTHQQSGSPPAGRCEPPIEDSDSLYDEVRADNYGCPRFTTEEAKPSGDEFSDDAGPTS